MRKGNMDALLDRVAESRQVRIRDAETARRKVADDRARRAGKLLKSLAKNISVKSLNPIDIYRNPWYN